MRHHRNRGCTYGFTVIELLVVCAICALLAGLMIAAVQSARESARRAACTHNMKQIALAMQAYLSAGGRFPGVDLPTGFTSTGIRYSANYFSPMARALPDMEQRHLFDAINFALSPTDSRALIANQTVMQFKIHTYLCPSDGGGVVPGYGRVNYRVSLGPTPRFSTGIDDPESLSGPFTVHVCYSSSEFSDGLSNTVGISERLQGDWMTIRFRKGGDYWLGSTNRNTLGADWAVTYCDGLAGSGHESRGGESWLLSGLHFTCYNHCATPNSEHVDCAFDSWREGIHIRVIHEGVFSASSHHIGGVNCSFMDGSVRFVGNGVNHAVWRAIATRAGGEAVSADGL